MQFRMKALQQMRKPDEIDQVVQVATLPGWVAVLALVALVGLGATWSFVGSLPRTVTVSGLLSHPQGVSAVQSTASGQVVGLAPRVGDTVRAGSAIARLAAADGATTEVRSPFTGLVVSVGVSEGEVVAVGTTVLDLERTDGPNDRLVAFLFLPPTSSAGAGPGMPVSLSVSTAPSSAFGVLHGRVSAVSPYPATPQQLQSLLADATLASQLSAHGPPTVVTVDLTKAPDTPSGYAWSSRRGPPFRLLSQVTVSGRIQLGAERPIDLVFGR